MAHAILSPSGASRWMACAPSARLEAEVEDTGSVYAREGSVAHALSELYLRIEYGIIPAVDFETNRKQIDDIEEFYNEEMQDHVEEYVDFVKETVNEAIATTPDAAVFIEHKINLTHFIPEGYGTGDCIVIAEGVMYIIDLKYGKGVLVDAHQNKQLMIYALGALHELGFLYTVETVKMFIYQPRLHNYSTFEMSAADLYHWAETELKEKARIAFEGVGEFVPGPHCGFCKVKTKCKTIADYYMDLEKYQQETFLTVAQKAEILSKAKGFKNWIDALEEAALEEALAGTVFPGYKLVEGRSNRKYSDPDKVAETVLSDGWPESDVFTKKVISITNMEKLVGKKTFDALVGHLVVKPQGKPALVPETDNRKSYNPAALDFSDLLD